MLKFILPIFITFIIPSWPIIISIIILLSTIIIPNLYYELTSFISKSTLISLDIIRAPLLLLTLWVSSLIIIASFKINISNRIIKEFSLILLCLTTILILRFSVNSLIIFYIIFEASLIPTLLLILGWGYQPERLQAGIYLMIYTVTASLPLLAAITFIFNQTNRLFFFSNSYILNKPLTFYLALFLSVAFLIKIPLYISHIWLPKAHVEAPVSGSIVLARILLKLGSYGLLRLLLLWPGIINKLKIIFITISLWGLFATAIICVRQQDIKSLIAYSSVGHMAIVVSGIYTSSNYGFSGSITIIVAHGLSSSILFAIANINYESTTRRSIVLTKGLLFLAPTISIWWFIATSANIAAPPTLNLIREILLLTRILSSFSISSLIIALGRFLAAAYSLILYTSSHHGAPTIFSNRLNTFSSKNILISLFHLFPLYILVFFRTSIIT